MNRPPNITTKLTELPAESNKRREVFLDIFGSYLLWIRKFIMDRSKLRIESEEHRPSGTIFRRVYEQVAALDPQQREVCTEFAQSCIDDFSRQLLGLLSNIGSDLRLGEGNAVRFRLDLEIYDIESQSLVISETINRDCGHLPDRWGRWINHMFESLETSVPEDTKIANEIQAGSKE